MKESKYPLSASNFEVRNNDGRPYRFQLETWGHNDADIIRKKNIKSPDMSKQRMIKVDRNTWVMQDGLHTDEELIRRYQLTKKKNERNFITSRIPEKD